MSEHEVRALVKSVRATQEVAAPRGTTSLAIAILDSIHSTGIRYVAVERLLDRYRAFRRSAGADPDSDGVVELLEAIGADPKKFAVDVLENRNLTSPRGGVPKILAVRDACIMLRGHGVMTRDDFIRALDGGHAGLIESAWCALPGQRSGITWRYLRMLCGVQDVKPDRMIHRFICEAIGRRVSDEEAVLLVTTTAAQLDATPIAVDHRIWQHQRRRPRRSSGACA